MYPKRTETVEYGVARRRSSARNFGLDIGPPPRVGASRGRPNPGTSQSERRDPSEVGDTQTGSPYPDNVQMLLILGYIETLDHRCADRPSDP